MDPKFIRAEERGIRLEMVGGLPIWEPHPVWKHQKHVDRIRSSISRIEADNANTRWSCVHAAGV